MVRRPRGLSCAGATIPFLALCLRVPLYCLVSNLFFPGVSALLSNEAAFRNSPCAPTRLRKACIASRASPDVPSDQLAGESGEAFEPEGATTLTEESRTDVSEEKIVRIVAMSDTHGFHKDLVVPDGDILVHCGDAVQRWDRKGKFKFHKFVKWFKNFPHKDKIFISGNHEDANGVRYHLGGALLDGERNCSGLRIYGMPYSRNSYFYRNLPAGLDVLLTHEPPRGILDVAKPHSLAVPTEIGSKKLRKILKNLEQDAPTVHIFGHVHEARGYDEINGTLFVNAANANPGPATRLEHGCTVIDIACGPSSRPEVVDIS